MSRGNIIEGIPLFYDFHVAFLGEPDLVDVNIFFTQMSDYGRAGRWRVKILNDFLTRLARGINKTEIGAYHYLNDRNSFYQYVEKSKTILRQNVANQIEKSVHQVNFSNVTQVAIADFLKRNLDTLDADVSKMLETIGKG